MNGCYYILSFLLLLCDVHHIQYELLIVCGGDVTTTTIVGGKSSTAIIDQN